MPRNYSHAHAGSASYPRLKLEKEQSGVHQSGVLLMLDLSGLAKRSDVPLNLLDCGGPKRSESMLCLYRHHSLITPCRMERGTRLVFGGCSRPLDFVGLDSEIPRSPLSLLFGRGGLPV